MRLFYRLIVSLAYCGIFAYCQRGVPAGTKVKPNLGSGGSFGGTGNKNAACKGGGCRNTDVIVLGTFGGVGGIMTLFTMICYCYKRYVRRIFHRNAILNEAKKKTTVKYTPCDINVFKSGTWSARYFQFGVWSESSSVTLTLDNNSHKVNGSGTDDVGKYTIDGSYSIDDGRMVLVKLYQLGTGDPEGNLGHRVFIRLVWNSEAAQFEGPWYIRTKIYSGMDRFELKFNDDTKIWMVPTPR